MVADDIEAAANAGKLESVKLTARFDRRVEPGQVRLELGGRDLQGVVFIDSSGLGALISGIRDTRLANGDLLLAHPNDQAKVLLELTTLDQILRTYPTVSAAMQRCSE